MPPSTLSALLRPPSKERRIISTLQHMLRANDHSIWWRDFPDTPIPDTVGHRSTRMVFYSFEKFEEHRDACHAALSTYGEDDSDHDQQDDETIDKFYEPSDWQGQDGNGCSSCEHFKDVWITEEWVFGAACVLFEGEEHPAIDDILDRILENRGDVTLEEWIDEKVAVEEERDSESIRRK
jgi:hypothetical protein